MTRRPVFLAANWQDLILLNFAVPDALLQGRLPPGVELDRYEGSAYVSLVAFDFVETRVLGIAWPGFVNFAEINLRFYVRRGDVRGVCFIREIVPQRLTAWFARLIYNEPYVAAPIHSQTERLSGVIEKSYELIWNGAPQQIAVTARDHRERPAEASAEHFFKEHEWGYGVSRAGKTLSYRVEHSVWDIYPVTNHRLHFDFAAVYGPAWAQLNGLAPNSLVFAAGSAIKVFVKE